MADRFPLIVDSDSQAIKEVASGDNILLTGNNLLLSDNDVISLGTGQDLKIYHDGVSSIISDSSASDLSIRSNVDIDGTVTADSATFTYLSADSIGVTGTITAARGIGSTFIQDSATGNQTLDFSSYQNFILTLKDNITLINPTTETQGQSGFITFIQDATGSRTLSVSGTDYETIGGSGITLSTAANSTDIVPYVVIDSARIILGAPTLATA